MVTAATPAPTYLAPVDPQFMAAIQAILGNGQVPISRRRKEAGEKTVEWLAQNGRLIRTPLGAVFYLHQGSRRLFSLETEDWSDWFYLLTGCNPESLDHRYLRRDVQAATRQDGEIRSVLRCSHWDSDQGLLRVSRFDGTVYRLDGTTIEEEGNGDGPVLFDDDRAYAPYLPLFSGNGETFTWSLSLPNWLDSPDEYELLYRYWWLATFFTELCPTRPILLMHGGRGSGKSMACRIVLRSLFGPDVDVHGQPEKSDAFQAMTTHNHILVLDNLDTFNRELQDKIAGLVTGKIDSSRRLYTNNEEIRFQYRNWLAVTSRTPDTLQRDDLIDRLLILPLTRLDKTKRLRELLFLEEAIEKRGRWWGDVLMVLNRIVAEIRRTGIPAQAGLRMEDWASLSQVMAQAEGQLQIWQSAVNRILRLQVDMLLDDPVVQSIEAWLRANSYSPSPLQTRALYDFCQLALFGLGKPDSSWPHSARAFGRRLAAIAPELQARLADAGYVMSWRIVNGYTVYQFLKQGSSGLVP